MKKNHSNKNNNYYPKQKSVDETEYLASNEANLKHLNNSLEQIRRGEIIEIKLDDL